MIEICLLLLCILQMHNVLLYPLSRGFDAFHHQQYIEYLKIHHSVPLPNHGWEMWQPPLYYIVGAILNNYVVFHYVHVSMWIILGMTSFFLFRHIFKDRVFALTGTFFTISLPVVLYLTPAISNEFFSAVIISVAMTYYLIHKDLLSLKRKIILGLLLGLTILAKATGLLLVFCIFIDQIIENRKNFKKIGENLSISFAVMIAIGGWFYIRNIILFGNPFIASIDFPAYAFTAPAEGRGLEFFFNLMPFFQGHLFTSQHEAFLPGTYFSFFYDGHNNLIPVQEFSRIGIILVIMTVPLFIFSIIGYLKEFRSKEKNYLFLMYIPLLFLSYILYNFKIPYYSTVKGAFLVSAIVPWAYFLLRGLEGYKKYMKLIMIYIFIYTLVLLKNFWILSWWYRM